LNFILTENLLEDKFLLPLGGGGKGVGCLGNTPWLAMNNEKFSRFDTFLLWGEGIHFFQT
jgi:hypothetical protein